jgi:hypothetical protein
MPENADPLNLRDVERCMWNGVLTCSVMPPHTIKQITSTPRQASRTVSRQQTWMDSWTSWPNVTITKVYAEFSKVY